MKKSEKLSLWLRWVGANAMAEMVGLGATFAIDFLIIAQFAGQGIPVQMERASDIGRFQIVDARCGEHLIKLLVAEGQPIPQGQGHLAFDAQHTRVYADGWAVESIRSSPIRRRGGWCCRWCCWWPSTPSYRHRCEVNNVHVPQFEAKGMKISARTPSENLPEIMELPGHPFFVGVQFHPEFTSTPRNGHPLFKAFVEAALANRAARSGVRQKVAA